MLKKDRLDEDAAPDAGNGSARPFEELMVRVSCSACVIISATMCRSETRHDQWFTRNSASTVEFKRFVLQDVQNRDATFALQLYLQFEGRCADLCPSSKSEVLTYHGLLAVNGSIVTPPGLRAQGCSPLRFV